MSATFDRHAEGYEGTVEQSIDFSGLPHDFFMAAKADILAETVVAHFGPGARPSLLDVGCGVGRLHDFVRPVFGRIAGVDVSAESVARAALDHPGNDYAAYPAGDRLPHADASFDMTLAVCVVHHVAPADWPAFVAEMARVTRPGGLVALIEHNPLNPATRLAVMRCPFDEDAVLLGAREARRLLVGAGCEAVSSRHFLLLPSARPAARRVERAFGRLPIGAQYLALGRVRT